MKIKKARRICLVTALSIAFCILIAWCVFHVPLWLYQITQGQSISVDNYCSSIAVQSKLSMEEILDGIRQSNGMDNIDSIRKMVDIKLIRETPRGYYAVIETSEKQLIYCFFDYTLTLTNILIVQDGFFERGQVQPEILNVNWSSESKRYETKIPYQELNTGASYVVFYYQDGIDIVHYNIENDRVLLPNKVYYSCTAIKIESITYSDLVFNPKYWFDPYNDLRYILKQDLG